MNLGTVLVRVGHASAAKILLEEAAAFQRERGPGYLLAATLSEISACHRLEGDPRSAHFEAVKAVGEATRSGLPPYLAGPLRELARAELALGNPQAALVCFAEARAVYAELGDVARAGEITRESNRARAAAEETQEPRARKDEQ